MPSSNPETIPVVISLIWNLAPKSVLDLGAGLGKYGVLFREYLELRHQHRSDGQPQCSFIRTNRQVRIDCVEGFPDYIGDLHKIVYDNVYEMNILKFIEKEFQYDFVFAGDILEHIDKPIVVQNIIPRLLERTKMGVLISVPANFGKQEALFGNTLEIHRSSWRLKDFNSLAPFTKKGHKGNHLIVFMTRDKKYYKIAKENILLHKLRNIYRAVSDSW